MLLKIRRSWCGTTAADSSSSTPLMRRCGLEHTPRSKDNVVNLSACRQSLSLGADGWAVDSMPTLSIQTKRQQTSGMIGEDAPMKCHRVFFCCVAHLCAK